MSSEPCFWLSYQMWLQKIRGKSNAESVFREVFYREGNRTRVFSMVYASNFISSLVGTPLSWYLMKINVWVPMFVMVGLEILSFVLCLFLPETLVHSKIPVSSNENGPNSTDRPSFWNRIIQAIRGIQGSLSIFESYVIFGLSFTFLLQTLHSYSTEILFQLASERFHWSFAAVSLIYAKRCNPCSLTHMKGELSLPDLLHHDLLKSSRRPPCCIPCSINSLPNDYHGQRSPCCPRKSYSPYHWSPGRCFGCCPKFFRHRCVVNDVLI